MKDTPKVLIYCLVMTPILFGIAALVVFTIRRRRAKRQAAQRSSRKAA